MARRKKVEVEKVVVPVEGEEKINVTTNDTQSTTTEQPKGDDTVKSPPGNIR